MRGRIAAGGLVALATLVQPETALADECAPSFVHTSLDAPRDGDEAARNVHVRVDERTRCGRPRASVPPQYRLRSADGPIEFDRVDSRFADAELVPRVLLPIGTLIIEARDPIGEDELGPWHALATLEVVDRVDETAPALAGILAIDIETVEGSIAVSPCEAEPAPAVETRVRFRLADDGATPHDELLYVLDRRPDAAAEWTPFRAFRPEITLGVGSYSWTDEYGFDQTWTYRLRVVDAAGHETVGAEIATVTTPPRPSSWEPTPPLPSSSSVPEPMLASTWRWAAALATLLVTVFVALRRRSPRR